MGTEKANINSSISLRIFKDDINKVLKKQAGNEKLIIIIDDLERKSSNLSMEVLLGVIEEFNTIDNIYTIIIANEKEIKIQQDILNGKSKEEIMKENGISHTTYYRKSKNARQLRLERTEAYLDKVIDEVYPDLEKLLKSVEISKRNLVINSLQEAKSNSIDIKKMTDIKKIYDGIKAMGNDLIRTGKLLTSFELLEIDKQLSDESLQLDKINIEKDKKNVIEEIEQVVIIDDTDKN